MRGGKRAGAGRKREGSAPRVVLSCRVSVETAATLESIRREGESVGQLIDRLVHREEVAKYLRDFTTEFSKP
jgi:uncharacterized protein with PIN domain